MSGLGSPETLSGRSRVCSERHDVLYSGARKVLNKRYIRRPWFNMNPFMENTDLMVDLENFLPEESKDIQPRESLVLCEHYNVDLPIDTREIALDGFFKYLNSDAWLAGCSVRVLEGQLLDQLLLGLYHLEREKTAVRHTTHAVARIKRPRTGCHKPSKAKDFGTTDDTILLEFAYFGRLTKDVPNTKTLDPFEYLHKSEILEDEPEQETDETNNENLIDTKKRGKATMKTSANRLHAQVVAPRGAGSDTRSGFDRGLSSVGAQSVGHPEKHWECVGNKRIVTVDVNAKSPHEWRNTISQKFPDFEEEDDDYDLDLKFSNGTGLEKEEEKWEKEERDNFFGEEFYLSDQCEKKPVKFIGTKKLLQKKKAELQKRREERKAQVTEKRENNKPLKLPPLPPLELIVTPSPSNLRHETIKLPDHVPTMEEFIKILKNDEYIDPRFRNSMRLKRRRIAQRYNMEKGTNRNLTLLSTANIRHVDNETLASPGRGLLGSSNTVEKRGSVSNVRPLQMLDKNDSNIELPVITLKAHTELKTTRSRASMEVLGVTDSLPCKDHFYSEATTFQTSRERYENPKPETHKRRCSIPSLPTISSSSRANVKGRRATHDEDKSATTSRKSVQVVPSRKIISNDNPTTTFFKVICESEIDDSVSSDESVSEFDESTSEFDTHKLNFKYSIERLRKKPKGRCKKKPAFVSILAKYYKMQNVLNSFKSSVGKESKIARFRANTLGKTAAERKAAGKMMVGKLKLFAFLDTQTDKLNMDNVSRGDFSRYDLDCFYQELRLALDKFVVRREVVMSVLQTFNTTITSVTFTLPACFQQQHNVKAHEH